LSFAYFLIVQASLSSISISFGSIMYSANNKLALSRDYPITNSIIGNCY